MTMPDIGVAVLFDPERELHIALEPWECPPDEPPGDCVFYSIACAHRDEDGNCGFDSGCPWLEL